MKIKGIGFAILLRPDVPHQRGFGKIYKIIVAYLFVTVISIR